MIPCDCSTPLELCRRPSREHSNFDGWSMGPSRTTNADSTPPEDFGRSPSRKIRVIMFCKRGPVSSWCRWKRRCKTSSPLFRSTAVTMQSAGPVLVMASSSDVCRTYFVMPRRPSFQHVGRDGFVSTLLLSRTRASRISSDKAWMTALVLQLKRRVCHHKKRTRPASTSAPHRRTRKYQYL